MRLVRNYQLYSSSPSGESFFCLHFVRSGYIHLNLSPVRSIGAISIARSGVTGIDVDATFYMDISKDSIRTSYNSRRDYAFPLRCLVY